MKKLFLTAGIASPLVYLFTVIFGALLRKDYSHISHAISELVDSGAPNRDMLNFLFNVYGLLAIVFGIAALIYVRKYGSKLINFSIGLFLIISIFSFLWAFFPMDQRGTETTFKGIMHIVIAAIVSPSTIVCILLAGLGFRKIDSFKSYSRYSMISACFVFVSGIIAAISPTNDVLLPYMGLFERLTIGTYSLWILITAVKLLSDEIKTKAISSGNRVY